MKNAPDQPVARLPILMGGLAWACVLGGPVGFFASGLANESAAGVGVSQSAALGILPVALGAVVGLIVLAPAAMRTAAKLGVGVVMASSLRLLFALGGGAAFYLVLKPTPVAFWAALLTAGLACLIVDVVWSTRSLRRANHGSGAFSA